MPTIDRSTEITDADRDAILAPLGEFSASRGFAWNPEAVTLVLRDDTGAIVGGLIGQINWQWLRIEILAVDASLRGQGWGRSLVETAEQIARDAGARNAWVDTFSFQSPGFYERLGYREFGHLPDYPAGETRYFLSKPL